MNTEPKTITLEVKDESGSGDDRSWGINVVAKDEKGNPPEPMRIYGERQKIDDPRRPLTNGAGEANFRLYLARQEPPESQAHPNLSLEVTTDDNGVTFGVRVSNHDMQLIPGVAIAFSSGLGTFEQQGLVITDDGGKAACRLARS
jgi:hypothetical protein